MAHLPHNASPDQRASIRRRVILSGRLVYGQPEKTLKAATEGHAENPTLDLPCRIVFAAGQRAVEVIGPLLEAEAAALQTDFWKDG